VAVQQHRSWEWVERASWIVGIIAAVVGTFVGSSALTRDQLAQELNVYFDAMAQKIPEEQRKLLDPFIRIFQESARGVAEGKRGTGDVDRSAQQLTAATTELTLQRYSIGSAPIVMLREKKVVTICGDADTLVYSGPAGTARYAVYVNGAGGGMAAGIPLKVKGKNGQVTVTVMGPEKEGLALRVECSTSP
jgi:hypothetical protein